MTFAGQTAWITGASSGLGAAMARVLAKDGAHVIVSGRNAAALAEVAADCPGALVLPFEATDYAAAAQAAETAWAWAAERSGGIDLLVNNAGISQRSVALETAFPVYERIVAVDLLAPIALTQAVLPHMAARGQGRLGFVSSIAGKVGSPMRTGYSAAKFGLIGYADALRVEVTGLGLHVHTICPGSVRTNVSRNALTSDGSARGISDKAIDNGLEPEAIAREILDAIARDEREIIAAVGFEKEIGELRRTPEALMDRMAELFEAGYAQKMKEGA
ncbi:SDR family NAD(P)-dependent oxidoreductase [Novosphingobium sp. KCTC 2891]|uniref:SDR family NAD(P)-dependent oxidoreductase n=1 Tax=Novosphingobium sp. KCTC 2891 TaxID=2989730 RepID=UPI0022229D57|nr:SDR family NAD(P)-dependent oxidoreductase [Novosphingobium sp. KCTC 2891]MCW1382444.1 SDR family NAD(P)-dependent oxidoreductase [Novosphingobium sp. KCTC 2891]